MEKSFFEKTKQFFKGEISKEEALKKITGHPVDKKYYEELPEEKKSKLVEFYMKNPTAKTHLWDEKEQEFVIGGITRGPLA